MGLFSCNDRVEGAGVKQRHPGRIHAIISMSIGTIRLNLKYREMQRGAMPRGEYERRGAGTRSKRRFVVGQRAMRG